VKLYVLLGASLLLAGCASLFQPAPPPYTLTVQQQAALQARRQALAPVSAWTLAGRLSIKTGDDAWAGKLLWQQSRDEFRIHFNTPTGQGAVQLMSNPQFGVEMRPAQGGVYYADDAETLLYEHTGWKLPVSGMRFWIVGLPVDQALGFIQFDAQSRIQRLEQSQWRIEYKGYQSVQAYELPRKITLENDQLKIRIVIDRWEVTQ
jgi:outer membrane lipoprotein LolB